MEKELVFSIEENAEGGFVAEAPEHSIQAEAGNLDELVREVHYAVLRDFDEKDRPTLISLQMEQERQAG